MVEGNFQGTGGRTHWYKMLKMDNGSENVKLGQRMSKQIRVYNISKH